MIEFLRQWIMNIVVVSIFIALLEAILPDNNFKGYVKMISGFLMIIVLLNPFIKLISNNISIDKEVFANIDRNNEIENSKENITISNEDQIKNLYIDKIKNNIIYSVESNFQYDVMDVDIEMSEGKETYGEILEVSLNIIKNENKDMKNNKIVIEEIESSNSNDKNNKEEINYDELKEYISKEYNIPFEKITINE
ncbi:stage III sporulation protein AF [Clostridium sp. D2Q-14]|uniref:stage III sporulation protein AF n=1 Tax=Anaeromonas gelatinilytica TaxID=2683194 RepID=UPI00193BC680|nr:stage III sporulation protein AF [Anaeromonas gelatinilytica]MBS4536203.1 stage III sporulation protein AF [Anaeromonas gelatinilytica]